MPVRFRISFQPKPLARVPWMCKQNCNIASLLKAYLLKRDCSLKFQHPLPSSYIFPRTDGDRFPDSFAVCFASSLRWCLLLTPLSIDAINSVAISFQFFFRLVSDRIRDSVSRKPFFFFSREDWAVITTVGRRSDAPSTLAVISSAFTADARGKQTRLRSLLSSRESGRGTDRASPPGQISLGTPVWLSGANMFLFTSRRLPRYS